MGLLRDEATDTTTAGGRGKMPQPGGSPRRNPALGCLPMKTLSPLAVIVALGIGACTSRAHTPQDADPRWRPAIDLVLSAFAQFPLVALSDGAGHGQLETRDFFAAL